MYLSFYALKEEPFRLTPDPRFMHLAVPHREALTKLVEGIASRKGVLIAVGPVGTGKTTILHATQHILEYKLGAQRCLASAFLLNPTMSREDFLEAVLDEFEVSCASGSKAKRLTALHEMLLRTHQRGGISVLIVDEAHLLSAELVEEVRLLTNMDSYGAKLLQVVLCGQPELAMLLLKPELKAMRQRIAVVAQLRPLTQEETRAYVLERLHAAGLRGPAPFEDGFFPALFEKSGGVPRVINVLCDNALASGYKAGKKDISADALQQNSSTPELETISAALVAAM
jgi:general secretion pathway protein A